MQQNRFRVIRVDYMGGSFEVVAPMDEAATDEQLLRAVGRCVETGADHRRLLYNMGRARGALYEWRPAETAPETLTVLAAYVFSGEAHVAFARREGSRSWFIGTNLILRDEDVLGWIPLPEAPAQKIPLDAVE